MSRTGIAGLAAEVTREARRLLSEGFFAAIRRGVFAITFEEDDEEVFGSAEPADSGRPELVLFPGEQGFFPFSGVVGGMPRSSPVFEAAHVIGVGYRPLALVPPRLRSFVVLGGDSPGPSDLAPFFYVEPARAARRLPDAEEAELLARCLKALVTAHRMGPLRLLPPGSGGGSFPEVRVDGAGEETVVTIRSGFCGMGMP